MGNLEFAQKTANILNAYSKAVKCFVWVNGQGVFRFRFIKLQDWTNPHLIGSVSLREFEWVDEGENITPTGDDVFVKSRDEYETPEQLANDIIVTILNLQHV